MCALRFSPYPLKQSSRMCLALGLRTLRSVYSVIYTHFGKSALIPPHTTHPTYPDYGCSCLVQLGLNRRVNAIDRSETCSRYHMDFKYHGRLVLLCLTSSCIAVYQGTPPLHLSHHQLTGWGWVWPQTDAKSAVETAIEGAKESCESGTTGECAAAWDEVFSPPPLFPIQKQHQQYSAPYEVCRNRRRGTLPGLSSDEVKCTHGCQDFGEYTSVCPCQIPSGATDDIGLCLYQWSVAEFHQLVLDEVITEGSAQMTLTGTVQFPVSAVSNNLSPCPQAAAESYSSLCRV